ncbi:MAG: AAA family ATPase [Jatrophihabitans sp.]
MPRLVLLNGPPGSGKSTLARRFAEHHPLTLVLTRYVGCSGAGWISR